MEFSAPRLLITSDNSLATDTVVAGLILALKEHGIESSFLVYDLHLERLRFFQGLLGKNIRVISDKLMLPQLMVSELGLASSTAELTILIGSGDFKFDKQLSEKLMMPLLILDSHHHSHSLTCQDSVISQFNLEHLFSFPSYFSQIKPSTINISRSDLIAVKDQITKTLDFEKLLEISRTASEIKLRNVYDTAINKSRIAVASDPCFSLMIPNNLELLKYFGAEIVTFSPLVDRKLPVNIGGLYIPGGYIFEYGTELSHNKEIHTDIAKFFKSGGAVFSEGAGTAYLAKQFSSSMANTYDGVGILPARVKLHSRNKLQIFDSELLEDSILGGIGSRYTYIDTCEFKYTFLEEVMKIARVHSDSNEMVLDGFSPGAQSFLSTGFINFASNPRLARELVLASSVVKI